MTEINDNQPFYKLCSECFHYVHTDESIVHYKNKATEGYNVVNFKACTRFPQQSFVRPDFSCGEWICQRCWSPWDMIEIVDMENPEVSVIDHSKCEPIKLNVAVDDESEVQYL